MGMATLQCNRKIISYDLHKPLWVSHVAESLEWSNIPCRLFATMAEWVVAPGKALF